MVTDDVTYCVTERGLSRRRLAQEFYANSPIPTLLPCILYLAHTPTFVVPFLHLVNATMPPPNGRHKHTDSVSQNHKAQLASAYNELGKELSSSKIKVVGNYTLGKAIGEGTYSHLSEASAGS